MKNATKNKLLLCFKPEVLEFESESESIENKDDIELPKIKSPHLDVDSKKFSEETSSNNYGLKQNLLKVFRVAMFHTTLNKMRQHSFQSRNICSLLSLNRRNYLNLNEDKSAKAGSSNNKDIIKCPTDSSSSSSSNQSLGKPNTSNSSQPAGLINHKQDGNKGKMKRNMMGFLCFILFSLLVTIFWGKLVAVFFTSLWLCFDLRQHQSSGRIPKPARDRRSQGRR